MNNRATFSTASRGFSWSFVSSLLVLVASLAAQLALGRLLSKSDFGVYAIAISCSNMFVVFRDGGVNRWLSRMSRDEFDQAIGKATAVAILSCLVVAALVASLAWFAGQVYGQPKVTEVMLILALGLAISPYSVVGLARLNVDLRFREMAWIKLLSGVVRYGLAILLAWRGFGPLSFAWPVVAVAIIETALYAWLTRIPVITSNFSFAGVKEVFSESKWSLSGSFAEAIVRQCDYLVLALLIPVEVVGVYFFAFNLAMQPVNVFSESLRKVVMPIFSQLSDDKQRESRGIHYAALFIGLIAAPSLLLLSVTAEPVLNLLWGNKWLAAVLPLQVLAMVMPFQILSLFVETLVQSRGFFRYWTFSLLVRGIGLGLAAGVATWITDSSAAGISVVTGIYLGISAIVEVYFLMRKMDITIEPLLRALPVPLACTMLTATALIVFVDGKGVSGPLDRALFLSALFGIAVFVVLWCFSRSSVIEVTHLLRRTKTG